MIKILNFISLIFLCLLLVIPLSYSEENKPSVEIVEENPLPAKQIDNRTEKGEIMILFIAFMLLMGSYAIIKKIKKK